MSLMLSGKYPEWSLLKISLTWPSCRYWNHVHNPDDPTQTYQYHEATYSASFNYDDFFSNFTASKFNAKSWVDLVAAAGAQYIVPVTSLSPFL